MKLKIKNIIKSDEAVAGVVVGLLFIVFIITAISFIQTSYVPQWIEDKEAEHMDKVANQFSQIKFSIDTLSAISQENSIVSNPVSLGTKENPFLMSSRSYGDIEINPNECKITVKHSGGEETYLLGSIIYNSKNSHYINQKYVYETGGLIISQDSGDAMIVRPSMQIVNKKGLSFNLFRLIEVSGKSTASGYGTYSLQTKFKNSEESNMIEVNKITIENSYLEAWEKFFDDMLSKTNKIEYTTTINTATNELYIDFIDDRDADYPYLSVIINNFEVNIAHGWG